ncbi:threonine export protein RhtC [Acinetobacter haemolyticus]|uniref:Threonine export protein RhtC n=1 Tax=Acinetobacter haemolyticus TaxID=29430 RepID=A0AAW4JCU2_ACIHA|nr:threonine export protein RhtC [Acinetobacter haemolyticus]MBO3657570.1 threonine export protein RhtC [Acinetobacter haemolyticus]WHR58601.1 threonine export protein RhtC [Acinetobacter haemolyticus]
MLVALSTLIFIHFCALITPGPDFFLVSQTAISRSRKEAVLVVLGICIGAMLWSLLALMGLNIIFEKMAWLKQGLLIAGGLYLCWLGYQMLRSAFSKNNQTMNPITLPQSPYLFFMKGLLTNLSNPKAIIYFGSVFSLFLTNPLFDQHHSLLFIIVSVETALWFTLVAFVFSLPAFRTAYQNFAKWIDGVSGGIFTLLGVYLIGSR